MKDSEDVMIQFAGGGVTDDLRKLAEAATPGPWTYGDGQLMCPDPDIVPGLHVLSCCNMDDATMAYIAAAHPQAVLALLDQLVTEASLYDSFVEHHEAEVASLKAELDELLATLGDDERWSRAIRERNEARAELAAANERNQRLMDLLARPAEMRAETAEAETRALRAALGSYCGFLAAFGDARP